MSIKFYKLLLVFTLCLSLPLGWVATAQAQGPVPTATPLPTATQVPSVPVSDVNVVSFEKLQQNEIQLTGPYDAYDILFAIPADWKLKFGTQLNLMMNVSFNKDVFSQYNYPVVMNGGTLNVYLNDVLLAVLQLNEVGEVEQQVQIPLDAFISDRTDGRVALSFVLDSSDYCYVNDQFTMFIHTSSYLTLPHELVQPDVSLVNFPRPISQNSFDPDSALLIVPEQPSAEELQAALTVAATLGSASNNTMQLDMTTLSKITPEQTASNHLIFVGKASSLPALEEFKLPQPVTGGQFQIADGNPDDGVIEMIVSPWSDAHVVLVVSGNTDSGTLKASQAISSRLLRPNRFPNLSIVEEVQPAIVQALQPVDRTLIDLGSDGTVFSSRGFSGSSYNFYIPPGSTVAPDAYFELVFGHSSLLNYNRSVVLIRLNGRPIGSVRMDDASAKQTTNRVKIDIPASAVITGNNRLDVRVDLLPLDSCTPPGTQGLWFRVWPESLLHLPLEQTSISPVADTDLAKFPEPFINDPSLSTTAFVLSPNDLESWRVATRVAAFLGYYANGSLTTLSAFYSDAVPAAERQKYNLLLVGRPSQMPIINEVNDALPAPFPEGTDTATETNFQVVFRIPPDSPLGYVELIPSPWNTANVVLAVLGNTAQGVGRAVSSLIDPIISRQLAGNFAVVDDQQVVTTDTRSVGRTTDFISTPVANPTVVSPIMNLPSPSSRPVWILPALILTVIIIIAILTFVIIGSWSRNRASRKNEKES